jgi:hypothetical protein
MNKLDAYVILFISEFIPLSDFVRFTRTSKEYRETLITDNIQKRFETENTISTSYGSLPNPHESRGVAGGAAAPLLSDRTTISCSIRHNPIVFDDYYKNLYYGSTEKMEIEIQTPVWRFQWNGYFILTYDIEDLRDHEFTVHVAQTQFAEIDMILFFDKTNERIMIYEIRFSYITQLQRWLRNYYRIRYANNIWIMVAIIIGYYTNTMVCGILSVYGLVISVYLTRFCHPSYFEITPHKK